MPARIQLLSSGCGKCIPKEVWLSDSDQRIRKRQRTDGKLLKTVGRALILLEDIRETEEEYPLAVFSAEISGNPHYFDQGTTAGQLLVHGMCYATRTDYPENAHRWRELLLSNGIVPDNISSIVHIYGLRLQIDSDWHLAYDAFAGGRSPVRLPWKICRS